METLKKLVKAEAKALRENATKEELSKLNFINLDPNSFTHCIYGQMTGGCMSTRALILIDKCATRVYDYRHVLLVKDAKLNGAPNGTRGGEKYPKYISPIEKFIVLNEFKNPSNNERLIKYLKGETKTLKLI